MDIEKSKMIQTKFQYQVWFEYKMFNKFIQ
jgi:hypothetical protein